MGDGNFFSVKFLAIVYVHNLLLVCVVANEVELPWNGHASLFFSLKTIITHSTYLKKIVSI